MADNVAITAGSGTTVATDDVAGVHYQFVKIADGTLDSTNKLIVDTAGAALTVPRPVSSATLTNVSGSATAVTLLASNSARVGYEVFNDSTSACYVKHGSTASATSFTVKLAAASYYTPPYRYTGIVTIIWDTATGSARVTEY